MATPSSANVSVGKPMAAGGIHAAPAGTAAPTDATTALANDFVGLGYVSDEGLTNTIDISTQSINAWGGDEVLSVRTSRSESFSWTFIETNKAVMEQVYGPDNVTEEAGALTVVHNNKELPRQVYVFEILMTGNKVKRIVVPNGQINEIGEVTYSDGEAIGYQVTLACFPDGSGNTVYEYIAALPSGD